MQQNRRSTSAYKAVILQLVLLTAIGLKYGFTHHPGWYSFLYVTIPLLVAINLSPYWKDVRFPGEKRQKRIKPFTLNS
jgi:hypothetical protein